MSSESIIVPPTPDEASPGESLPRADFQAHHNLHDSNVVFEEYLHYAARTRAQEARQDLGSNVFEGNPWNFRRKRHPEGDSSVAPIKNTNALFEYDGKSVQLSELSEVQNSSSRANAVETSSQAHGSQQLISNDEWLHVSRATRNASWSAVFFLITTDIFGPISIPWSITQLGYGPGVAIYTVFGALAGYSGYQLWVMFMHLDSDRHPLKTYGDLAFRIYGPWARYSVNVLQSLQLFFSVSLLALSSGQSISQISSGKLCFVICTLVFCIAGFVLGQVRTLRTFGWLANFSIWINVIILSIVMGVVAHSPPNYSAALAQNFELPGPIVTSAGIPAGKPFELQVIGVMQAVYSYAGTMLFCEFMSEMRRPWDFWKGMLFAQSFIYMIYIFYGLFVYSFQGQFTILTSNQGISIFVWQSITNAFGLVSALILACLYGNIGIKLVYSNIGRDLCGLPPLESRIGKMSFAVMVPVYWSLAFVFCSAIPSITNISGLISAVCVVQFTYTFPPILLLGYMVKKDSMTPDEAFNPVTGEFVRVDRGLKRLWRGFKKHWMFNTWNFILAMGAASTAALGIYASVEELILVFAVNPAVTSLGCTSPIGV